MSYDLLAWHAPTIRDTKAAHRAMDEHPKTSRARLAKARAFAAAVVDTLPSEAFSVAPIADDLGRVGIALTASRLEASLATITRLAVDHGFIVYDPQSALFTYADGRSSRDEAPVDGVSEGVHACIRDLGGALTEAERVEALSALSHFAMADSDDRAAAAELAIVALVRTLDGAPALVSRAVVRAAHDLADGLDEDGATVPVAKDTWAQLDRLAELHEDARHVRLALSRVVEVDE